MCAAAMELDIEREAVVQVFLGESAEGLAAMEEALVFLEARPHDTELLALVFRTAHTLKGNAASLGFDGLAHFCHTLEDLLERLRDRTVPVTPDLIALLLRACDAIREILSAAVAGDTALTAPQQRLLRQLGARATALGSDAATPSRPPAAPDATATPSGRVEARTLRVDTDKLDHMLDLTGEIAIARNRLRRMLEQSGASPELLEAHGEVDRLSFDLQEIVMKVRLVPLRATFRQHIRTVRDLAVAQGKRARLVLEGEDVEADTSVIEHVRDPLTHMIRNAVDHGIERPDVREARGKDPCGTITLRARHESGTVVIEITDDGAGLDRERILEKAGLRGAAAERLGEVEVERLVFEPGLSTAAEVTELSGRGVGLDVVRRNVHKLRGTVALRSRPGEGTALALRLPLTLAIIDGFGVGVGDETYVIPLDSVSECLQLPAEITSDGEGRGVINLRGTALPCLRLRHVFAAGGPGSRREHVVVVRQDDGRPLGLVVDDLLGGSQTVIKPLGRLFRALPGIAGSAILGSGRVALILDVPTLLGRALPPVNEAGHFNRDAADGAAGPARAC